MKFAIKTTSEASIEKLNIGAYQEEITNVLDIQYSRWFIEIKNLEHLMQLARDLGEKLIIEQAETAARLSGEMIPEIEIYDGWRE